MTGQVSHIDPTSFQTVRPRLVGIATRVLRDPHEADDVVQDAWIRWQGTDRDAIRDPTGFLVTMTGRLALTVGHSARARREISSEPPQVDTADPGDDPSRVVEQAEALEHALGVLLEKLSATERAAYILREAFDYPHRRIAEVMGLTEANARQLVTRARVRLRGERRRRVGGPEHRRLLDAFVAAAQTGAVPALERLLTSEIEGAQHEPLAA